MRNNHGSEYKIYGEGLFFALIRGPGKVWLQLNPFMK